MSSSSEGITVDEFVDCLTRAERFGWRYAMMKNGVAFVEIEGGVVRAAKDKKELEMVLGLAE